MATYLTSNIFSDINISGNCTIQGTMSSGNPFTFKNALYNGVRRFEGRDDSIRSVQYRLAYSTHLNSKVKLDEFHSGFSDPINQLVRYSGHRHGAYRVYLTSWWNHRRLRRHNCSLLGRPAQDTDGRSRQRPRKSVLSGHVHLRLE